MRNPPYLIHETVYNLRSILDFISNINNWENLTENGFFKSPQLLFYLNP